MIILPTLIYVLFGIVGPCVRGLGINCRGNADCGDTKPREDGDAAILGDYLLEPWILGRTFGDGESIGASVYVEGAPRRF